MRLLLVEDNVALAGLLTKGLAVAGYEVDAVATVSESLAALATTRTYELRSSFRPAYNMAVNLVRNYTPEELRQMTSDLSGLNPLK